MPDARSWASVAGAGDYLVVGGGGGYEIANIPF